MMMHNHSMMASQHPTLITITCLEDMVNLLSMARLYIAIWRVHARTTNTHNEGMNGEHKGTAMRIHRAAN